MAFGPLLDLRPSFDTDEFRALLLLLVGWREERDLDQQRLERVIQGYRGNSNLHVLGFESAGAPIAMSAKVQAQACCIRLSCVQIGGARA